MNLINDGIGLLLGLAPVAALVALVLAGLTLRNHESVLQNGRFGLWMFWSVVMLTLPQILSWFSGFGMNVPISAGGGTPVLNVFKVDVTNFVNQFLVGYFAPVLVVCGKQINDYRGQRGRVSPSPECRLLLRSRRRA
jgi:hypothetical protein